MLLLDPAMAAGSNLLKFGNFRGLFGALLLALLTHPQPLLAAEAVESVTVFPLSEAGDNVKPSRPLPEKKHVRVENRFGAEVFSVLRIDLDPSKGLGIRSQTATNSWRATHSSKARCSTLFQHPEIPHSLAQSLIDAITMGNPAAQLSQHALTEMKDRDYISHPERNQYLEGDSSLHPNQSIQFASVSWVTPAEFNQIFPGRDIPWHRFAEVQIAREDAGRSIEDIVRDPNSKSKILIRRASLRLLSDFVFDHQQQMVSAPLPWESNPHLGGRSVFDSQPRLNFELSRGSQIPGLEGESLNLARFATIAMVERFSLIKQWPNGERLPLNLPKVYLHSLKESNTRLYERILGMKVVRSTEAPYHALMETDLRSLIVKLKPWEAHPEMKSLMSALTGKSSGFSEWDFVFAIDVMQMLRHHLRQPVEARIGKDSFNGGMTALVLRRRPDQAISDVGVRLLNPEVQQRFASEIRPILEKLTREDYSESVNGFVQDPGANWKDWPSDVTMTLSGFDKARIASDKDYVLKVLTSVQASLKEAYLEGPGLALITDSPEFMAQAANLGLHPRKLSNGTTAYFANNSVFAKLEAQIQELKLKRGVQRRADAIWDVESHFYRQWVWTTHPSL